MKISMAEGKRLKAVFYRTPSGAEPVRDWLRTLSQGDRRQIGEDIKTCEFGWPIGMPICRALGKGLWEVRTTLKDRIARVLFVPDRDRMVLLHGFIKKSQATPQADLELARSRQRYWENER
jgi:phage-related protein